jgi:hypothetical protein
MGKLASRSRQGTTAGRFEHCRCPQSPPTNGTRMRLGECSVPRSFGLVVWSGRVDCFVVRPVELVAGTRAARMWRWDAQVALT